MELKLNEDLDFRRFQQLSWRRFTTLRHKSKLLQRHPNMSFEAWTVFQLIHHFSNYREEQWSFWKQEKSECINQMKSLLIEISTLDRELTYECMSILEFYKKSYKRHHQQSLYVNTTMSLMRSIA